MVIPRCRCSSQRSSTHRAFPLSLALPLSFTPLQPNLPRSPARYDADARAWYEARRRSARRGNRLRDDPRRRWRWRSPVAASAIAGSSCSSPDHRDPAAPMDGYGGRECSGDEHRHHANCPRCNRHACGRHTAHGLCWHASDIDQMSNSRRGCGAGADGACGCCGCCPRSVGSTRIGGMDSA